MPTVLITGATGGLGSRLSAAFWAAGYSLVLVGRDLAKLAELEFKMKARNGQTIDVCLAPALSGFLRKPIDCLISTAAEQGPIGPFDAQDLSAWAQTIAVNLTSQAEITQYVLPNMPNGSSIIFLSGGGATGPRPNFSAYAASKAGLVRFAETLAHELKQRRITVNCIAPGVLPTAMLETVSRSPSAGAREVETASKALASWSDEPFTKAAKLALFLASAEARSITGKLISAVWDDYERWPAHSEVLGDSDAYTLRRITGRDRGLEWGDLADQ